MKTLVEDPYLLVWDGACEDQPSEEWTTPICCPFGYSCRGDKCYMDDDQTRIPGKLRDPSNDAGNLSPPPPLASTLPGWDSDDPDDPDDPEAREGKDSGEDRQDEMDGEGRKQGGGKREKDETIGDKEAGKSATLTMTSVTPTASLEVDLPSRNAKEHPTIPLALAIVGSVSGVAALAGAVWLCIRKNDRIQQWLRRRHGQQQDTDTVIEPTTRSDQPGLEPVVNPPPPIAAADKSTAVTTERAEAHTIESPQELPANVSRYWAEDPITTYMQPTTMSTRGGGWHGN